MPVKRDSPTASSSQTSESSMTSGSTESTLAFPSLSEKFGLRMRPCPVPLWQRKQCPCCGRNFRAANEALSGFRDFLQQQQQKAITSSTPCLLKDLTNTERSVLLSDSFLTRLLARCQCDFKRSHERLLAALTVHRKYSLDTSSVCDVCVSTPGYHSFRQVGFDRAGRPVLYTCLNQDFETGNRPEQVKAYFAHLIRTVLEAEKTIPEDQHSLVLVFDTTGLGMSHVRAENVAQFGEMLKYFPSRMSYALLLNMMQLTRVLLKPVIHLTGHQHDVMVLAKDNLAGQLAQCFHPPLVAWMVHEAERNQQPRAPFCRGPAAAEESAHDPRGESAYVAAFVQQQHPSGHRPHPSILAAAHHHQEAKADGGSKSP